MGVRAPPPVAWDLAGLSQAHGPLQLLSWPGCCVHLCQDEGHGCGTAVPPRARLPPHSGQAPPALLSPLAGGLTAVIYTDALQTLVMVAGAVILTIKGEGRGPIHRGPPMSALGVGVPTRPGCGALSPLPASPEWQKPVPLSPQLPCGTSVTSSSRLVFGCRADAGSRAIHIHPGSVMGGGAVGGVPPHHWETTYLPGHLSPLFETLYKQGYCCLLYRVK